MKKRIISAVLAAVVALSAVPASALPPAVAEEKTETSILEEQETGIQDMAVENAETETSDTSDDTAGGEPGTAPEGDAGEEPAEEEFGGNTEQDEPTDQGAAGQLPEEDDLLITAPPEPEGTVPDNNLPENTENRLPESQDTETPVWTTEDMEDDAEDNTEEDTAESFQIQIPDHETDHAVVIFETNLKNETDRAVTDGGEDVFAEDISGSDTVEITEMQMPEMKAQDSQTETGTLVLSESTGRAGRSIDMWTDQEAGLISDNSAAAELTDGEEPLTDLEKARELLPPDVADLLTGEIFRSAADRELDCQKGAPVKFYVIPSDGYEVDNVRGSGDNGAIEIVSYGEYYYGLVMPDSDVSLYIETSPIPKPKAAVRAQAADNGTPVSLSEAAARSGITVQKVNADTKMNQDYAFTYAFREGVTTLKSISRYNGTLNSRLHNWFGDDNGFTTAYCNTFYGALINDSTYADPVSVLYSNVGEYQGETVDLKVTASQWGMVNNNHVGLDGTKIYPCILFYKDRIAFNTISVGTVRFQFEFYKHNTNVRISPKGHVTMADLDGGQGFRVYNNWGVDGLYIRNGYDHLKATTGTSPGGSSYLELRSTEGVATTNSDPKGWCQVDFNGSFTVNWLAQDSWLTSTSPMNAFYVSTSQSVGTYEPNPDPEKRVGDAGSSFESMEQHATEGSAYGISPGKSFDYVIAQRLLPGNYSLFEVTDTLDSCLTYRSAKVETSGGQDVTKYFRITQSGGVIKFSAQAAFLKTDEAMNDVTYYFRISVTAKDQNTIAAHGHYKSSVFYIMNNARRQITSSVLNDIRTTNDTYTAGAASGSCSVRKVDGEDTSRTLTGAVFALYQWTQSRNQYVFMKNMSYNPVTDLYESGNLDYTEENQGKFRIIETAAPEGYDGGWQRDVQIAEMGNNKIYEAVNNKTEEPPRYGRISLTKKDSVTGEVIEAKDGVFKVLEWNSSEGEYLDLLNTPDLFFDPGEDRYVSEQLLLTDENEGKFQVVELQNPEGYEGSFIREVAFDLSASGEQEVEITAYNTPKRAPVGEITVTKKIREDEIIWAHGNPVFRFRVSGRDVYGTEHTYENYVEFRREGYTVRDGYAYLSCSFENVPSGQYTVSELPSLRYVFENVSGDTDNVEVSGETGVVLLEGDNSWARLTFTNRKTAYDRYSHTDVIRNSIPVTS